MSTPSPALPAHPSADAVLAALDPEQREVAASPLGPMCVLAGAGTGKTRAITHRIAYGVLAGASGIVAMLPNVSPQVHQVAGALTAVGTLMLGISAKSKNVTGVEKKH